MGVKEIEQQERLGRLLRELREEAGLTQEDVALRISRPQSYVSKYEAGEVRIDLPRLRLIAAALDEDPVSIHSRYEKLVGPTVLPQRRRRLV